MACRRRLAIVWLCAVAAACTRADKPTQLLVWIRADAELAEVLARVHVGLYASDGPAGAEPEREVSFDVTNAEPQRGEQRLPFSFGIARERADDLKLIVRGFSTRAADATPVIERTLDARFGLHRTVELTVLLAGAELACSKPGSCPMQAGAAPPEPVAGSTPPPPMAAGTSGAAEEDAGPHACADRGAACDPVTQCGCNQHAHCQVDDDQPVCMQVGTLGVDAACQRNRDCALELSCMSGACRRACRQDGDCQDAVCIKRPGAQFGGCGRPCAKPGAAACAEGLLCSPLQLAGIQDSFCLRVESMCSSIEDGVCDEARIGTGFCASGSDTRDCCSHPRPDDSCDPFTGCGCADGTTCRGLGSNAGYLETGCRPIGDRPVGSVCDLVSQCQSGLGCFGNLCKQLCPLGSSCSKGSCVSVTFSGQAVDTLGACTLPCDFASGTPCLPGSVCAQTGRGSFCYVQPAMCPMERYGDHVCDETSRLCAPGTDSDQDCKR